MNDEINYKTYRTDSDIKKGFNLRNLLQTKSTKVSFVFHIASDYVKSDNYYKKILTYLEYIFI